MARETFEPAYLTLLRSGELRQRVQIAAERVRSCDLCGRACQVDRYEQLGSCRTGTQAVVSSYGPHLVVDIYMPDVKYADAETAYRYSRVRDYVAVNRAAVKEMHRQVGDLTLDERSIALRGLLVRHLVLPEGLAGTAEAARFLAEEVSPNTYVNVMDQYRPC